MFLELIDKRVSPLVLLAYPVPVESGVKSAELVLSILSVVSLQVMDDSWGHVSVLITSSH